MHIISCHNHFIFNFFLKSKNVIPVRRKLQKFEYFKHLLKPLMTLVSFYNPWKQSKTREVFDAFPEKEISGMKWINKLTDNAPFVFIKISFIRTLNLTFFSK